MSPVGRAVHVDGSPGLAANGLSPNQTLGFDGSASSRTLPFPTSTSCRGGAYLLERWIGCDITHFFTGAEAFDAKIGAHVHSGRAYQLLQSMTVAALKSELATSSWADAPSLPDDACTDTWVLVRKTVLQGDPRRPIVSAFESLHSSYASAAA